jgi:immune inhibitor A
MADTRRPYCVVPPAPELYEKIARSKERFIAGERLPADTTVDVVDLRAYTLIMSRPPTLTHIFVAPALAPVTGTRRALVLLVDFSDKTAAENQQHYKDMLFSSSTYPTGSMRDFYREASYGQLTVTGEVFGQGGPTAGWFRAPQQYTYYTNNNYGFGAYPQNAQRLVEDAVTLADPIVNFANYDNDGDGVVDALFIVHAGLGAEVTGNVNDIWSHAWGITPKAVDGVTVQGYSMEPEDGRIGVFSHELGHVFGLPDLYDTDYTSAGTGSWDLMAGGSWNDGGLTPAHPLAWCKVQLGWVNPTTIFNAAQSITVRPSATHPDVFKLPVKNAASKEYYLLENRQQIGFDKHLPGEGLIITHIDENQTTNTDETHYLVDVEEADGKFDLDKNANRGDATDPFPTGGKTKFDATTTPNSKAYDGTDSKIAITNIQQSGDNITADVNSGGVAALAWHYNVKVVMTFAHHTTQWAWAYIDTLGWRRIKDGAPDGVTNIFGACCEARANSRLVHVYADDTFIYTMYLL